MRRTAAMAQADRAWMVDTLLSLLQTPSPSGRTDAVMQLIGDMFSEATLLRAAHAYGEITRFQERRPAFFGGHTS